jgi:hypothetical protein
MVHRESRASVAIITCDKCVTAWRPSNNTMADLGATISHALDHVCDPGRPSVAPVAYRDAGGSTARD